MPTQEEGPVMVMAVLVGVAGLVMGAASPTTVLAGMLAVFLLFSSRWRGHDRSRQCKPRRAAGVHVGSVGASPAVAKSPPLEQYYVREGARGASIAALGHLMVTVGVHHRIAVLEHNTKVRQRKAKVATLTKGVESSPAGKQDKLKAELQHEKEATDRLGRATIGAVWSEDEDRGINEYIQRHLSFFDGATSFIYINCFPMTSEKRPLDVQQEVARWRLLADVLDATPDWWTNHPCSKNEHDFIVTRVDRWERLSAYLEHTTAEDLLQLLRGLDASSPTWCGDFFPSGNVPLAIRGRSGPQLATRFSVLFSAARSVYRQYESDPRLFHARVTLPLDQPLGFGTAGSRPVPLRLSRQHVIRALKAGALATVCRSHPRAKSGPGGHRQLIIRASKQQLVAPAAEPMDDAPTLMTSFTLEDMPTVSFVAPPHDGDSLPGEAVDGINSFRTSSTWRERTRINKAVVEELTHEEATKRDDERRVARHFVPNNSGGDTSTSWDEFTAGLPTPGDGLPALGMVNFAQLDGITKTMADIHSDVVDGRRRLERGVEDRQEMLETFKRFNEELKKILALSKEFEGVDRLCNFFMERRVAMQAEWKTASEHLFVSPHTLWVTPKMSADGYAPGVDVITDMLAKWVKNEELITKARRKIIQDKKAHEQEAAQEIKVKAETAKTAQVAAVEQSIGPENRYAMSRKYVTQCTEICFEKGDGAGVADPKAKHFGQLLQAPDLSGKKRMELEKVLRSWGSSFNKSVAGQEKVRQFTWSLYQACVEGGHCTEDEFVWMFLHSKGSKILEPHTEVPGKAKRTLRQAAALGFRFFVPTNSTMHTDFVVRAAKLYVLTDTLPSCREMCLRYFRARCPLVIPELPGAIDGGPRDQTLLAMLEEVRVDDVYSATRMYAAYLRIGMQAAATQEDATYFRSTAWKWFAGLSSTAIAPHPYVLAALGGCLTVLGDVLAQEQPGQVQGQEKIAWQLRRFWQNNLNRFPPPEKLEKDAAITNRPAADDPGDSWRLWGLGMQVSAQPSEQELSRRAVYESYFRDDKNKYAELYGHIRTWSADPPRGQPLQPYPDVPGPLMDPLDAGLGLPGWLGHIRAARR